MLLRPRRGHVYKASETGNGSQSPQKCSDVPARTRRGLLHRDWLRQGTECSRETRATSPHTTACLFYCVCSPDIAEVMSIIQKQLNFKHTRKHPSTIIFEAPREASKETLLPGTSDCCRLTSPRKCLNRVLFKPRENAVKTHKTPLTNVRGGKSLYN